MATKKQTKPEKGRSARRSEKKEADPAVTSGAADRPPPGCDNVRHVAEQRAAHGAELLEKGIFPALMASALSLDQFVETRAYRVYLEQVIEEVGCTDAIDRMLIEQTCITHFRIARLHVEASHAKGLEATKILNAAAARLLGEMRRTALALRAYRGMPEDRGKRQERLRVFKEAQ